MKRWSIVAAFAAGFIGVAHAGFVDERPKPQAAPAAAVGGAQGAAVPSAPAVSVSPPTTAASVASVFAVTASDKSIRETLSRWSVSAGWTHEAAHWTIDKDLPIEGVAGAEIFGADYRTAVRRLLSSSELTDRPLQPCFYSNKVVRVIPQAGLCNRTAD